MKKQTSTGGFFIIALTTLLILPAIFFGYTAHAADSVDTDSKVAPPLLTYTESASNPAEGVVQANPTYRTTDVVMAAITVKSSNADTVLTSIPVTVTSVRATPKYLIYSLNLYQGSTLLDSIKFNTATTSTVTANFKKFTATIPSGSQQEFRIVATINPMDGITLPERSSALVSIPATGWKANSVTGRDATISGYFRGNVQTFITSGIFLNANPLSALATKEVMCSTTQEIGTFAFNFNVSAIGEDIYISSTTTAFTPLTLFDSSGNATTTAGAQFTSNADKSILGNYIIHSGQTKSVTIMYTKLGQGGAVRASLRTMGFGTTDTNPLIYSYPFSSNYSTPLLYLHGI